VKVSEDRGVMLGSSAAFLLKYSHVPLFTVKLQRSSIFVTEIQNFFWSLWWPFHLLVFTH